MDYEDFSISQDPGTEVWVVFQKTPEHGKQVVGLAETELEARQKIEEIIAGETIPLFFVTAEHEGHRREEARREFDAII